MSRIAHIEEATQRIKAEAIRLGFSACGIARAEATPDALRESYEAWIAQGFNGEMSYLERNAELRQDPRVLVPGTRSLIVVAMNYYPQTFQPEHLPQFAYYAYGRDYHKVVKKRLDQLLDFIRREIAPEVSGRAFADSAPILERYWAHRAGLGWIGKNGLLIIPKAGSFFFLGELLVNIDLVPDEPMASRCGACTRCLDSCPTKALLAPGVMDARRCISYLTIEQDEEIPHELAELMGARIYGCDACQTCCPWNRFARPTQVEDFRLRTHLLTLDSEALEQMQQEEFDVHFAGQAIRRAGLSGLKRSLRAIRRNLKE
ncbi:MAG: tRNA epoxyqueuosine(34) reductase QueG [Porphyromonadaceae bacterium]|nr:tRNA epoxyqueuosine(34) reductase QueG [Porphyromonadaceae bacterium]